MGRAVGTFGLDGSGATHSQRWRVSRPFQSASCPTSKPEKKRYPPPVSELPPAVAGCVRLVAVTFLRKISEMALRSSPALLAKNAWPSPARAIFWSVQQALSGISFSTPGAAHWDESTPPVTSVLQLTLGVTGFRSA